MSPFNVLFAVDILSIYLSNYQKIYLPIKMILEYSYVIFHLANRIWFSKSEYSAKYKNCETLLVFVWMCILLTLFTGSLCTRNTERHWLLSCYCFFLQCFNSKLKVQIIKLNYIDDFLFTVLSYKTTMWIIYWGFVTITLFSTAVKISRIFLFKTLSWNVLIVVTSEKFRSGHEYLSLNLTLTWQLFINVVITRVYFKFSN